VRIPSKLVIKGKIWSVSYKWNLRDTYEEEQPKCEGLTVWDERTIYLERSSSREDNFKTLIGEITHILLDELQVTQIISKDATEIICHGVMESLPDIYIMKFKAEHHNAVSRSRRKS